MTIQRWGEAGGMVKVSNFQNNLVFRYFAELIFANWNKVLRKLFLQIGDKFQNKYGKNVSRINFRNNQLPFFTFHKLFFYKYKAYKHIEVEISASPFQYLRN